MTASIIEHSDGTSFVVVTRQDGEHHVFDIMVTDSLEELGQTECESFLHCVVFKYSLLGAPNADSEDLWDAFDNDEEHA